MTEPGFELGTFDSWAVLESGMVTIYQDLLCALSGSQRINPLAQKQFIHQSPTCLGLAWTTVIQSISRVK